MTDEDLMRRVRMGKRLAYAEIIERYYVLARNRLRGALAGDLATANDLTQQVFMRIWERRTDYTGESKFTTYLYAIVRHHLIGYLRTKKRHKEIEMGDENAGRCRNISHTQEDSLSVREQCGKVLEQIWNLPEKYRAPLVLYAYGEFSYQQIAEVLNISHNMVRARIASARNRLSVEELEL